MKLTFAFLFFLTICFVLNAQNPLKDSLNHQRTVTLRYANGRIRQVFSNNNGVEEHKVFGQNGQLQFSSRTKHTPSVEFQRTEDRNGLPIQSLRIDTLGKDANPIVRYWDTLYYDNGKPYKIQSRLEKENFETQFYHKDGSLAKTVPPDSLKLKVYKDNIDCYYGLVNKRGDTIVKARFDHINPIGYKEEAFWEAHLGESLTLLDPTGTPITPFSKQLTGVESMVDFNTKSNEVINNHGEDTKLRDDNIKPLKTYYAFREGNKYGVINEHGMIVIPPQYFPIQEAYTDDDQFFHFEEGKYTTTRTGFVNREGKPLFADRFKSVSEHTGLTLVFDEGDHKRKKLILLATGQVVDYPFNYTIEKAVPNCCVILVKDTAEFSYGVVSTDGKLLMSCVNYGVAIGEVASSVYFVKRDTPYLKQTAASKTIRRIRALVNTDTLNIEDNGWLMYNADGKLLDEKPFRFPIDFKKGVGIGMQDEDLNLYKTDGTILLPFSENEQEKTAKTAKTAFQNIRRDPKLGFYALYYTQGLTPSLLLTKSDGEILVHGGRYNGISNFYDKYALVLAGNKVGLIDSFGREMIAPQDLRTYTGHFMDSLDLYNKMIEGERGKGKFVYSKEVPQPIRFRSYETRRSLHPDSLKITVYQRASLWNLMLEKCAVLFTANNILIPRAPLKANADFLSMTSQHTNLPSSNTLKKVVVGDSTISFVLEHNLFENNYKESFYNFYRRNNRWEEVQLKDILHLQLEKRMQLNDLITQKIKALKNAQIDCSNPTDFIGQVETRFMLTKEGIDFCFKSAQNSTEMVVVSCAWADLLLFLKKY